MVCDGCNRDYSQMVILNSINLPSIKLGYDKEIHDRMCTISLNECFKADVTLMGDTDVHNSLTSDKQECQGIMKKLLRFYNYPP